MDENVFRIVVAVGVGLATLSVIVQAFVMLALYRASQKMQVKMNDLSNRVEPVIQKVGPMLDGVRPVIEKVGPIVDRFGPIIDKFSPVVDRIGPTVEKVALSLERLRGVLEKTEALVATVNHTVDESRPRIAEVSGELVGMAKSARKQVDRVGELVDEITGKAHTRIEQIDGAMEHTFENVEQAGDVMKRAMLRPVKEVNGIAAGVSAAVATLVKGRKSSVDTATQDEEMFI